MRVLLLPTQRCGRLARPLGRIGMKGTLGEGFQGLVDGRSLGAHCTLMAAVAARARRQAPCSRRVVMRCCSALFAIDCQRSSDSWAARPVRRVRRWVACEPGPGDAATCKVEGAHIHAHGQADTGGQRVRCDGDNDGGQARPSGATRRGLVAVDAAGMLGCNSEHDGPLVRRRSRFSGLPQRARHGVTYRSPVGVLPSHIGDGPS